MTPSKSTMCVGGSHASAMVNSLSGASDMRECGILRVKEVSYFIEQRRRRRSDVMGTDVPIERKNKSKKTKKRYLHRQIASKRHRKTFCDLHTTSSLNYQNARRREVSHLITKHNGTTIDR